MAKSKPNFFKNLDPKKVGALTIIATIAALAVGAFIVSVKLASVNAPTAPEGAEAAASCKQGNCDACGRPPQRQQCWNSKNDPRGSNYNPNLTPPIQGPTQPPIQGPTQPPIQGPTQPPTSRAGDDSTVGTGGTGTGGGSSVGVACGTICILMRRILGN